MLTAVQRVGLQQAVQYMSIIPGKALWLFPQLSIEIKSQDSVAAVKFYCEMNKWMWKERGRGKHLPEGTWKMGCLLKGQKHWGFKKWLVFLRFSWLLFVWEGPCKRRLSPLVVSQQNWKWLGNSCVLPTWQPSFPDHLVKDRVAFPTKASAPSHWGVWPLRVKHSAVCQCLWCMQTMGCWDGGPGRMTRDICPWNQHKVLSGLNIPNHSIRTEPLREVIFSPQLSRERERKKNIQ